MTSSNISNVVTGYQPETVSKGNVDSAKKTEEAQAVFATLLGQTNLNVGGQNEMPKPESQKKVTDDITADRQPAAEGKTTDYAAKEQTRVKKAENTDKTVEEQAEALTEEAGEEIGRVMEEEFSVTEEELQNVLEELGMNLMDLLNPAKLAQVVSKLTGVEDVTSLLMNEDFVNVMQSFGQLTTDLAGELGISAKELQQLLTEASTSQTTEEAVLSEEEPVLAESVAEETVTAHTSVAEGQISDAAAAVETDGISQNVKQDEKSGEVIRPEETVEETSPESVRTQQQENASEGETQTDDGTAGKQEQGENLTARRNTQNTEHTAFEAGIAQNTVSGQTSVAAETPVVPVYTTSVNVSEILQQIAEFVKVNVSQDTTSLEMQLNPENLGKLYLHISSNREGGITAQFTAQSEVVKEALETQLVELKQTLNQQGVKVDAIEVSVAAHEFERNLEQSAGREQQQGQQEEKRQGRRGLHIDSLDELSGLMTEEEQLAARIMQENGNSMDVTA